MAVARLIAKPAVKRVNRIITIPKTARTILRPDPKVLKQLQQAVKPRKTAQYAPPKKLVAHREPLPRARQQAAAVRQIRTKRRKGPSIRYHSKEVTAESKEKIRKIRNFGKGKTLIMVGNGPSISEVDLSPLRNHPKIDLMSINKPDPRVWPTEHWLFCDATQFKRNEELWGDYQGQIYNTTAIRHHKPNSLQIKNIGGMGFSKDLMIGFHVGRSSVYAAMQVALWLGYDHTYIFGCDMSAVTINGKEMMHFYGSNPDVQPKNRAARFENESRHYEHAAGDLPDAIRAVFTFCSSHNKFKFVERFNNRLHQKDAVATIIERVDMNEHPKPTWWPENA